MSAEGNTVLYYFHKEETIGYDSIFPIFLHVFISTCVLGNLPECSRVSKGEEKWASSSFFLNLKLGN